MKIKLINILKHHQVKLMMLLVTTGVVVAASIRGYWIPDNIPLSFLCALLPFQFRGIMWEEQYRLRVEELLTKVEELEDEERGTIL